MTNEEKQLLLIDLCTRLPHDVKCNIGNIIVTLEGITKDGEAFADDSYFDAYDMKPYLRPMSSMTEEERKEFNDFCVIDEEAWEGNSIIGFINQAQVISEAIDWLNSHYFDYRGLIEKGLALEAPEGMYKIE